MNNKVTRLDTVLGPSAFLTLFNGVLPVELDISCLSVQHHKRLIKSCVLAGHRIDWNLAGRDPLSAPVPPALAGSH